VPHGSTYKINEVGNLLHVLFYRTESSAQPADEDEDQ